MNQTFLRTGLFFVTLLSIGIGSSTLMADPDSIGGKSEETRTFDPSAASSRSTIDPECKRMSTTHTIKFGNGDNIYDFVVSLVPGTSFTYNTNYNSIKGRIDGNILGISTTAVKTINHPATGMWWWAKPAYDTTEESRTINVAYKDPGTTLAKLFELSEILVVVGENLKREKDVNDPSEKLLECIGQRLGSVMHRTAIIADQRASRSDGAKLTRSQEPFGSQTHE